MNTPSSSPLTLADRIDLACDRFEASWSPDNRSSIEEVLTTFEQSERDAALQEVIAVELELRFRQGEKLTVGEYTSRFPQQETAIKSLFTTMLDELMATRQPSGLDEPKNDSKKSSPLLTRSGPAREETGEGRLPESIGKYRIVEALGRGGQAMVYRAVHPVLKRDVVIKYCLAEQASDPVARESLASEGRVLAELTHPNLAKVYDFDFDNGRAFLVMEYARGLNLAQYARQQSLSTLESIQLVKQVAGALAYVHSKGVLHLDLKPQNILVDESGRPCVIDFGLARAETAWDATGPNPNLLSGTLAFMAPEQANCDANKIGPRSDIYGLGGVLYFLMTGTPPLSGKTFHAILKKAKCGDWDRSLLAKNKDEALSSIIERAMARDPQDRYASANELGAALGELLTPAVAADSLLVPPIESKRKLVFGIATSGCVIQLAVLSVVMLVCIPGFYSWKQAARTEASKMPPLAASSIINDSGTKPMDMRIRIWRNEQIFDLIDSAPVRAGDRIEIRSDVPADLYLTLFLFDSDGVLTAVDSQLASEVGYEYRFPRDKSQYEQIVGQSGTELLFLLGRRNQPVTVEEIGKLKLFAQPWPQLPDDAVVGISEEKVEFLQRSRAFGGGVTTVDPQQVVFDKIEQLRTTMLQSDEIIAGVAFSHIE